MNQNPVLGQADTETDTETETETDTGEGAGAAGRGAARRGPRLSLRFDLATPPWGAPSAELFDAAVEMSAWADGLGFDHVMLHEHHNTDDGYLPSPIVLVAGMATRTRQVQLVLSAVVATLRHPIHLAEELAVLDLLSHGRLSVVLGAGSRRSEFDAFGVDMRRRPSLMEEAVTALRAAWTGAPFEFRGAQVQVLPRPVQVGGPPLAIGGMSEASARRAARLGVGYQPAMPQLYDVYLDELRRLGAVEPDGGKWAPAPGRGLPMFLHVATDPDAAWARIAPHALYNANTFARWMQAEGTPGPPVVEDADTLRGAYRVVTPTECIELCRAAGPGATLALQPLLAGLDPELGWASLRLFEDQVLGALV